MPKARPLRRAKPGRDTVVISMITTPTTATSALTRAEEAMGASSSLRELGDHIAHTASTLFGGTATCFFPFVGPVSNSDDATFFHEEFSREHMAAQILTFLPIQEREFAAGKNQGLHRLFQSKSRVIDLNTMLAPEGLERTRSYNEFWRPCRIERQLFSPFVVGARPLGYLCMARPAQHSAFREIDRRCFEWLSQRALRELNRLVLSSPQSAGELLDALRSLPLSCAVFSPSGALLWLSAAAAQELKLRWLDTNFTDVVEPNAALAEWRAAAQEAFTREAPCVQIGALSVQRLTTRSGPLLLVLSERGVRRDPFSPARLRESWQLTARESEVLGELAAGRSNKEIAVRLDCSARTVDVHVSSLLRKAQCTSRAELIARVLSHF
jgi:DNA-binding CsgD family transcriptional regulator